MSWKLRILAALNVVGWAVVVPLLASSVLNPLLDFSDWPGSDLLARPAQDAPLADLGPVAKKDPSTPKPGPPGSRPGPSRRSAPATSGPGSGSAPSSGADSTGASGLPSLTARLGTAGSAHAALPVSPSALPTVSRPGSGVPGPVAVPGVRNPEPEISAPSSPGAAGAETRPDPGPVAAPPLRGEAPKPQKPKPQKHEPEKHEPEPAGAAPIPPGDD